MEIGWSDEHGVPCILLDVGDYVDEVLEMCIIEGAITKEGDKECYVVQFPGRLPEAFSERALHDSFPVRAF